MWSTQRGMRPLPPGFKMPHFVPSVWGSVSLRLRPLLTTWVGSSLEEYRNPAVAWFYNTAIRILLNVLTPQMRFFLHNAAIWLNILIDVSQEHPYLNGASHSPCRCCNVCSRTDLMLYWLAPHWFKSDEKMRLHEIKTTEHAKTPAKLCPTVAKLW